MIRKHPRNDLTNPPGQVVNPIYQEKTLAKEIDIYKDSLYNKGDVENQKDFDLGYKAGFKDGWNKAMLEKFPQTGQTSEHLR